MNIDQLHKAIVAARKAKKASEVTKVYKMRAECLFDIEQFERLTEVKCDIDEQYINNVRIPDCEATFSIAYDLESIRDIIRTIEDGHVMLQTVQSIDEYTGNRDYTLE